MLSVCLVPQRVYIKQVCPTADSRYSSASLSYLYADEFGAYISRLGAEHVLVEPDDLQRAGEISLFVSVAQFRRQIINVPVRYQRQVGRFGSGQEERLTRRRQPASPTAHHRRVDLDSSTSTVAWYAGAGTSSR
jgi:hypothetical protein